MKKLRKYAQTFDRIFISRQTLNAIHSGFVSWKLLEPEHYGHTQNCFMKLSPASYFLEIYRFLVSMSHLSLVFVQNYVRITKYRFGSESETMKHSSIWCAIEAEFGIWWEILDGGDRSN